MRAILLLLVLMISASAALGADDLVLVKGGKFLMGSPESENWRSSDEAQHEVTLSDFWISRYELTQKEYSALMGGNPSTF
ncbi:MAG: SUMF1/EgtB/PvdO family nonheme iron enzyme, partial [Synergistaceae bacterium]|nr:SUMF1/EgtB/PvdO family nonheme iron enzyme [Synergistaceae bacterium]